MESNQRAWLIAAIKDDDGITQEELLYVTANFEEVFRFRKICNEHKIPHAVRFKQLSKEEVRDSAYISKGKPLHRQFYNGVKSFFKR